MRKLKVLPPMRCDPDCGDCCGPVPVTETEYQRVLRFVRANNIELREHGVDCPLLHDGRCAVYDARPLPCRIFGHLPRLACSRGYNVDVDARQIERMLAANGEPTRLLHELLGPAAPPGLLAKFFQVLKGSP